METKLVEEFFDKSIKNKKTISVAGDALLDEYYQVVSNRISPEFPIQIIHSQNEIPSKIIAGGAANVIRQFQNLNVNTKLVSIVDPYASEILGKNINVDYCNINWNAQTPRKKRFYQNDFPLVRWDCEAKNYNLEQKELEEACEYLKIPKSDVIVFSDYDKGLFNHNWFKSYLKNNITIVDPKKDIEKWKNCTVFKPNSIEAKNLSGKSNVKDQIAYFMKKLNCKCVIITQSENGVVGCTDSPDNLFFIPPYCTPDVRCVIGAGDAFIAFFSLSLALGMSYEKAAKIAFSAGISYVKNKHNEPISYLDLLESCLNFKKIIKNAKILSNNNKKLVFTNGCFDILHEGHIKTLKFAKEKGEKLIVALNSDNSVKKLKGKNRPVNNLEKRMNVISQLGFVDYVVSFEEETPLEIIKQIQPDVIVKGGDYKKENIVGNEIAKEVYTCDYIKGISTTNIIKKIEN
jgi:D-beta-D-heptose 7-phosphate kinase/D-beta-D-heptose 1-phosphate adenosyltransferase